MKHIIFAIALMGTLAYCTQNKKKQQNFIIKGNESIPQNKPDTSLVRVLWAVNVERVNARMIVYDTTMEVLVPNSDSSIWRPEMRKIYDTIYECRYNNVFKYPDGKSKMIDTFFLVHKDYVLRIFPNEKWDTTTKKSKP